PPLHLRTRAIPRAPYSARQHNKTHRETRLQRRLCRRNSLRMPANKCIVLPFAPVRPKRLTSSPPPEFGTPPGSSPARETDRARVSIGLETRNWLSDNPRAAKRDRTRDKSCPHPLSRVSDADARSPRRGRRRGYRARQCAAFVS